MRGKPRHYRLWLLVALLLLGFVVLAVRLVGMAIESRGARAGSQATPRAVAQHPVMRPQIRDRKGRLVAGNIPAASLYADPKHILDVDDTVDRLAEILPDLDSARLLKALRSKRRFVWVHRKITPAQQARIHALGVPGLKFSTQLRRVYPHGNLLSHVLGYVDVDGRGRAGIEAWLERVLVAARDVRKGQGTQARGGDVADAGVVTLSIDLMAQHVLRSELVAAMARYRTKAAAGAVLDLRSGEVLAAVSLPDFDPNRPGEALLPDRLDRLTKGVYELGSVFKAFTVALVLELGLVSPEETLDVATPLVFGRFQLRDHHGGDGVPQRLDVEDIFVRSSNVGAGRLALRAGAGLQRAFLRRFGLLDSMTTELGPLAPPLLPSRWQALETVTVSYGHGLAVSPLQFLAASAALFNGGRKITPTFLKRSGPELALSPVPIEPAGERTGTAARLLRPEVSRRLRALMVANVARGTGRTAQVPGLSVGGKTGTAEKLAGKGQGRGYDKGRLRTSFLSIFPAEKPRFAMLVMLDEPKREREGARNGPASRNAAPVSGRIIRRLAPVLGITPQLPGLPSFDEQLVATY